VVLSIALAFAILSPIVVYPFAASTWSATELIMHPDEAPGRS